VSSFWQNSLSQFKNKSLSFYGIGEDASKNILLGTDNGLYRYSKTNNICYLIKNESLSQSDQMVFLVQSVYTDNSGIQWIGTIQNGIFMHDPAKLKFKNLIPQINDDSGLNRSVKSIFQDKEGFYWIGTDWGLNKLDKSFKSIKKYIYNPSDSKGIGSGGVSSIAEDTNGNIWFGTWGSGLHILNKQTGLITHFPYSDGNLDNHDLLANSCIMSLNFDDEGFLWIGLLNGILDKYNLSTKKIEHFKLGWFVHDVVSFDNTLWCPTNDGLFTIDLTNNSIIRYTEETGGLNGYIFTATLIDKNSILWIGSYNGLCWVDLKDPKRIFHVQPELVNAQILAMEMDRNNNLWISTNKGIIKFNSNTKELNSYNKDEGAIMNSTCSFMNKEGFILFGGANGITAFYPEEITKNSIKPAIALINFKLFNKEVIPGKDSPLKKSITITDTIYLKYNQTTFSFDFVALNYTVPSKNQYAYMLVGFDEDWVVSGANRVATYTNINHGNYVFKVKASNNDGFWNEQGASVQLIISPPFWKTIWFRLLIILLLVASILLFFRLRNAVIIAEKEKLEKLIKLRTQELLQQKEEISAQKELMDEMALQATELVARNISSDTFDVETLAGLLGMSRTQLYRKFQAILHQSPAEFILTVRINKAKQMLLSKQHTISEISYQLGFKYPGNFTKTFKEQTGLTPTEFLNQSSK
jgi:AraC-like DNA-binding protein/streptogramin lyase